MGLLKKCVPLDQVRRRSVALQLVWNNLWNSVDKMYLKEYLHYINSTVTIEQLFACHSIRNGVVWCYNIKKITQEILKYLCVNEF